MLAHTLWMLAEVEFAHLSRPGFRLVGALGRLMPTQCQHTMPTTMPTHLHYIILDELNTMNQTMESVFIEIISSKRKKNAVGTIYRPPSSDHNAFLLEIQQLLSNPLLQHKH